MSLVEKYADSFKRDTPPSITSKIRFNQIRYDTYFSADHNPESLTGLLTRLNIYFEQRNRHEWLKLFGPVVDKLDGAYIKMLKRRKELLDYDTLKQPGVEIDLLLHMPEDMVNWGVEEPDMNPREYGSSSSSEDDEHGRDNDNDDDDDDDDDRDESGSDDNQDQSEFMEDISNKNSKNERENPECSSGPKNRFESSVPGLLADCRVLLNIHISWT